MMQQFGACEVSIKPGQVHPEFFRLDGAREKASLVWRLQYPRRFSVDELRVLPEAGLAALPPQTRSVRISRTPLTAADIKTLVDTAINLHNRAFEARRDRRWWISLTASAIGGGSVLRSELR
jgi:hypothetical protein